uniref:ATP synthase complex subunit 8 n=1 Tax=Rachycentron canadum TaxID=141264 RepID=B5U135_RACCA|nr:ATP synthase F0 subunit 8 [Rachycentron canadum]ACH78272.1 ATPase subunit 8 [Rachycentron canadum]AFU53031.1 ATP synthase subunit 8 [Rachycentron canadum]AFU53033.1 ATP synthase subunit 8 [Rachycentron canadum]AFU53035.1 ATP synthase subunit 8 [Rachycentron canadum]AFU53037.1 ATP synthase subunit 8 [Rachycentron canadum]
MPQLNPSPWFMILCLTWFTFLIFLAPKILAHTFPNEPVTMDNQKSTMNSWNWPWH